MDVYKVGVSLAMTSNHQQVLGALSQTLLHTHARVNQLTGGFNRLHLAITGALAATAGVGLLRMMGAIVNKTKELSDELVKLERLGGDIGKAAASGELTNRAFEIAKQVPMRVTDLLHMPGAAYSIFGKDDAMKLWPEVAKFATVLRSQKDYKGNVNKDIEDMLRAGELTGRFTDPNTHHVDIAQAQKFFDLGARTIAATHGMVNPQTILGMAKQGGFTLRGLTDEGFYSQAIMAQAMGGARSGTAFLSLWQQMAAGQMRETTAKGLEEMGLLGPGEWSVGKGGKLHIEDAASKRLTGLLAKDPMDFAANLVKRFEAEGITDPEEQMRKVMRVTGRQTTQRYTAEQVMNFHQMLAERGRLQGGLGSLESFKAIMDKSVTANLEAMHAAWDNLLTAVAGPNSANVIAALKGMTSAFQGLTDSTRGMNPEVLQAIGSGLVILGGALAGGGAVAIAAALGPAGWITAGVIALGTTLVIYEQKIRETVRWALNEGPGLIVNAIRGLISSFKQEIAALPGALADTIKGAIGGILEQFKGALKSWFGGNPSAGGEQPPGDFRLQNYQGGGIQGMREWSDIGQGRRSRGGASILDRARRGAGNVTGDAGDGSLASDRAKFAHELASNPALRDKVLRIAANEQGRNAGGTQAVIESMMNRASARGSSLAREARWHRLEGGYYAPGSMGRGALESATHRAILEKSLANALAGGNVSNYATDNASSWLAAKRKRNNEMIPAGDINGESFFQPGRISGSGMVRGYQNWRRKLHVPPRPPETGGSRSEQLHTDIHIDGRKFASVMSTYQARAANRPSHGAQSADLYRAYPQLA